ncbi:MAG: nucleotidyltransferase domain-containing protein [Muribaculaceae bacterium]|nr:nucleotidyltransferase domain-containing protein [Roseburia sp.]MCM1431792.1 nucleotidyltransferase domain-containing protein [Muribaculaceae bacterium]MCM1493473.1 nucleotidyltransferase domain-containing protein [Muribaculaceae bacterium]
MHIDEIANAVLKIITKYSIKKVTLFGSRAEGTNRDDSDVDLIIEFNIPVSLITLSMVQIELEEMLGLKVDVVHGPVMPNDLIEIHKEVVLYAA